MVKRSVVLSICVCLLLAGCVTALDEHLPYAQLPEITVATQFMLGVSPSHPTAYLTNTPIKAGEKVYMLGTDKNAAWLLVLYNHMVGWMPTFYSRTNVGNQKPAIIVEPLSDKCTRYLGATTQPTEEWASSTTGSVIVQGSIYRPQTSKAFETASLALKLSGAGTSKAAAYIHTPLTPSSAIILFTFALDNLQKDSRISFELSNPSNEPVVFQAAFFGNTCPDQVADSDFTDRLPVGILKTKLPKPTPKPTVGVETPTEQSPEGETPTPPTDAPTPTPIIITRESGPPAAKGTALPPEIEQVLTNWDRIHHSSDRTLDTSELPTVLMGQALQQQQTGLENLRKGSCYWEFTDLEPAVTLAWQQISDTEVQVDMQKHWDAKLYCKGKFSAKDSFSDPFRMRYRLLLTDQWRITEKKVLEDGEPAATATPKPGVGDNQLRSNLLNKSQRSGVPTGHRAQVAAFVDALLARLDDFQLPTLGITRRSMTAALGGNDAGDRLNSLVEEIWADWEGRAQSQGFNRNTTDPGSKGFSPFRQLVIRLIQGRQGKLKDSQQHALHNYFTRHEDASVWRQDPDAVIGAINRESFRWP